MKPTVLELAVFEASSEQLDSQNREALASQIFSATVKSRKNTGAGFFTYFEVDPKSTKLLSDLKKCLVVAKIGNVEDALGFIIWTEAGLLDCLEGYTLSLDSTVGMDLENLSFELRSQ